MTPEQIKLARSALGLPNSRSVSYRNRFAAAIDSRQETAWNAMVDGELAERGARTTLLSWFHLTLGGASLALERGEKLCPEDFPDTVMR